MTVLQSPLGLIRLILVDDHAVVRDGLRAILSSQEDMNVVACASTAREGMECISKHNPDVVLMDLRLPQMDGLSAVALIHEKYPAVKVLMLSSADGDKAIASCLDAGAMGYVGKSAPATELLEAIRTVFRGRKYLTADAVASVAERGLKADLTLREVEILEGVSEGQSNAEIATSLGVAEKTIKNHLSSVFSKLGATDRTHAVTIGLQRGIIELPRKPKVG